ncbi:MFS transporter [Sphingobium sp. DEHP117]|uniref:MFS transporter n=1 Tax=Sphingobium sp. DEHP117 TaxID=2993436 RepID=UPI0027D6A65D|nr:MFS transporter [Sphingobium sp. DEHP117]MDQ4420629.1 MFS transporter [Sphingobium sp. DEHP117]
MSARAEPTHPLHVRDYRLYLIARFATIIGQYGLMLVIAWQAYSTARLTMDTRAAAVQLGLIGLAQFLPLFVLTPVSGWVADHFDRRKVAMTSILLQMVCTAILGVATYRHAVSLPLIFTIAGFLGVARCFAGPAFSSMAPRLLPMPLVPRAVALGALVWQSAMVAGPALGGYLYAVQPWLPHITSVGMFMVAIVATSQLPRIPPTQADQRRHPLRQMLDGLVYVRTNRLVLGAITLDLMAVLLAGSTALLPVYAHDIFHAGPEGLGLLAAATGIGAGLTALWFGFRPPSTNVGNRMLLAVAGFGCATALFGSTAFMPVVIAMPIAVIALFFCGVTDMYSVFVRQTLIQVYTPDAMRGRVSSVSQLTISASNELGEAESGFIASLIGPVTTVIAGGLGAIVIVAIWSRLFPEIGLARRFDAHNIDDHNPQQEKQP